MRSPAYAWYGGFETKPAGREYLFLVENGGKEPREFRLMIDDEVWQSNNAEHQDGPAVCGHRLLRELAKSRDHSPVSHYLITATELEEYRAAFVADGKRRETQEPNDRRTLLCIDDDPAVLFLRREHSAPTSGHPRKGSQASVVPAGH